MVNRWLICPSVAPIRDFCGDKKAHPQAFLLEKRRPGGVGSIGRGLDELLVVARQIDRVELRTARTGRLAEEHDDAAIRCPGRALVVETRRQDSLARTIR